MSSSTESTGVLLLQLGTPDSPRTRDVRRYLRQFLSDPRVLDMPAPARSLLLNAVILPFRPRRSAEAYRMIWTDEGSPLAIHTSRLRDEVQKRLGPDYIVEFGMRYQRPSIESAVEALDSAGVERIVILPLFPQYASAAGGSAAAEALRIVADRWNVPDVTTLGAFFDDPGFLDSVAMVAGPLIDDFAPDHVVFSYHGLPVSQVRKSEPPSFTCAATDEPCPAITTSNRYCYRAQCYATTTGLAGRLGLDGSMYTTTFQSRLAGQKWIRPYTDGELPKLYDRGVRRLAVLTPSFTADCLETIEEIGIRGREQWTHLGGTDFLLVPCVNSEAVWAEAVATMVSLA